MNENCWLKNYCNQIDCDKFCVKKYKLDCLYKEALISDTQRQHVDFRVDADGADLEAFKYLSGIEKNIVENIRNGTNIYLHSKTCGNGKTAWSLRLLQDYFNAIWLKTDIKCRALFINVPRYLLALKANISNKSDYIEHIQKEMLDCDLIIWDDIGTKMITEFEAEHLLSDIDTRIQLGKANIYTSNLSDEELYKALGSRLASRIANYSINIEFKGSDKRGINL